MVGLAAKSVDAFGGRPVEQVARFHEAAGVRARAEDHDGDVMAALRQAQHRGQAVARLGDEPGLPRPHIDVAAAQQMVGAVERDRPLAAAVDRVFVGAHDRRDALVLRGVRDQPRHVVGRRDVLREQAGRIGVVRGLEPELRGLLVHPADEAFRALRRDARQRARGGVVRRDQQQVQQVVGRSPCRSRADASSTPG